MNKKANAALVIQFIIFLAILAWGGYYVYQEYVEVQGNREADGCFLNTHGIMCDDFDVGENKVMLEIRNNLGKEINIVKFNVEGCEDILGGSIRNGFSEQFVFEECSFVKGERIKKNYTIVYCVEGELEHTLDALLIATI